MATLGSTGKAEAQQFDRKRKLFLVPLVSIPPQLEEQISDLADTHWGQIREQLQNLEKSLGTIRHVFHELIHDEGKAGVQLLSQIAPRSAALVKEIELLGGQVINNAKVNHLHEADRWTADTSAGDYSAEWIVNCAGLHCDRVSQLAGQKRDLRIVPFRGEYFQLKPQSQASANPTRS